MTRIKAGHLENLERFGISKEVKLILVLLAKVLMPLTRGEVIDVLVIPDLRDKVILVKEMYLWAVGTIMDTFENVGEKAVDALQVDRWDIELQIMSKTNRSPSSLLCHNWRRSSKFLDILIMVS